VTTSPKRRSGVTYHGEAIRQKTEVRRHGRLSLPEVAKRLDMPDSTTWRTIQNLRAAGIVRKLTEKRRTGAAGMRAALYELGREERIEAQPPQLGMPADAHPVAVVMAEWIKASTQTQEAA